MQKRTLIRKKMKFMTTLHRGSLLAPKKASQNNTSTADPTSCCQGASSKKALTSLRLVDSGMAPWVSAKNLRMVWWSSKYLEITGKCSADIWCTDCCTDRCADALLLRHVLKHFASCLVYIEAGAGWHAYYSQAKHPGKVKYVQSTSNGHRYWNAESCLVQCGSCAGAKGAHKDNQLHVREWLLKRRDCMQLLIEICPYLSYLFVQNKGNKSRRGRLYRGYDE